MRIQLTEFPFSERAGNGYWSSIQYTWKPYGLMKHQLLVRHRILTLWFFNMTYVFGFTNNTCVKCWKKHIGTQKSWWVFSLVTTTAGGKQEKQDNLNTWTECNTKVETTQALQDDQHDWLFEVPKMAHYSSKWSIYILSHLSVSIPSQNMSWSKEQVDLAMVEGVGGFATFRGEWGRHLPGAGAWTSGHWI